MTKKLVSVVVPAYNEEDCIEELCRRLQLVFLENDAYEFEVIVIENGSTDQTWPILKSIHHSDSRFKVLRMSRNFRMDGGITAGINYASGDALVVMTADLQDPPELISSFIKKWEEGYDNIYMEVTKRSDSGPLRRLNSRLFYWLAGRMTDNRIPKNASDFRLVDRRVYETVREMNERNRFVRGLFAWVGFRSLGIPADRPPRFGGQSKAYSLQVIDLAFKGIFAHSYVPLKLITVTGLTLSVVSILSTVILALIWIFVGVPFSGFGTIISMIVLSFSIMMFMIGVLAEYVGLIYEEVKQRPNFVVSATLGL